MKHPTVFAADFLFVAGKHWKVLVLLMVHTGMVGMVVCGGDKERDVQSTAAVLNEIGVGGLSVEVATDNEAALKSLVERGLAASSARGYHWRNISEARLQAKGIERDLCQSGLRWNPPFWDIWWDMSTGRTTHTVRERLGAPP